MKVSLTESSLYRLRTENESQNVPTIRKGYDAKIKPTRDSGKDAGTKKHAIPSPGEQVVTLLALSQREDCKTYARLFAASHSISSWMHSTNNQR